MKKEIVKEPKKRPTPNNTNAAGGGGHVAELANKLGKEGLKVGINPGTNATGNSGGSGGSIKRDRGKLDYCSKLLELCTIDQL